MAFSDDKKAQTVFQEYMYGDAFLVCPVTKPEISKMTVYLPVDITINNIPVFVKAGAIVPTVEVMNYIDEKPDGPYIIKVFTGADGEFMLYDDSGCDYEYENGEYSRIKITYDNTIGKIHTRQLGKDDFAHKFDFEFI